jgi:hypothetical protein
LLRGKFGHTREEVSGGRRNIKLGGQNMLRTWGTNEKCLEIIGRKTLRKEDTRNTGAEQDRITMRGSCDYDYEHSCPIISRVKNVEKKVKLFL